jgi:hypothetical protein
MSSFALLVSFCVHGSALAIGDSGGDACAGSLNARDLVGIAEKGTREELQASLRRIAQVRIEQRQSPAVAAAKRWWHLLTRPRARTKEVRNSDVETEVAKLVSMRLCNGSGARLLDHSVAAGNMATTLLLLELGAYEEALDKGHQGQSLFFRCVYVSEPNLAGRREAYRHLIQKGADLNRATASGTGPLQTCRDPQAIALMLELGARLDASSHDPLDHWTEQAVARQDTVAVEIVRVFANMPASDRTLSRETEWRICVECSGGETRPAYCEQLARLVEPRDRRIFDPKGFTGPGWSSERVGRCDVIAPRPGRSSPWWNYVDRNGDPLSKAAPETAR